MRDEGFGPEQNRRKASVDHDLHLFDLRMRTAVP